MSSQFQNVFKANNGKGLRIWIDYISYAKRLFASGRQDFWQDPTSLISVYSQAQGLLRSDVILVPLQPFYTSWLETHPQEMDSWKGKRTTFALKKLLALVEPRHILIEVLNGLSSVSRNTKPYVLSLGTPQQWMQWLSRTIRPEEEPIIQSEDIDSASMYLADFLRVFAATSINAIVLEETDHPTIGFMESIELYQPILNLAEHYQWSKGISLSDGIGQWDGISQFVDFVLYRESKLETLLPFWEQQISVGGGLNQAFWEAEEGTPGDEFTDGTFLFGKIPEDAHPEKVLELLSKW